MIAALERLAVAATVEHDRERCPARRAKLADVVHAAANAACGIALAVER